MNFAWKLCFYLLAGLGFVAAAVCGLAILGIQIAPEGKEVSIPEAVLGLAFGIILQPFAWSALQHAKLQLTETQFRYLGFGFLCKTHSIELSHIERFGRGTEKGQGGGRHHILVIEQTNGDYRTIKLSMYDGWRGLFEQLGERLGRVPQETKPTLAGLRFTDE